MEVSEKAFPALGLVHYHNICNLNHIFDCSLCEVKLFTS